MSGKYRYWYVKFPLDAYALGPLEFSEPVSEKEVREWARSLDKVERLPRGFQCWPTNIKAR